MTGRRGHRDARLPRSWVFEIRLAAVVAGFCTLGAIAFGMPLAWLGLGLLVYIGWHLYNLERLRRWLARGSVAVLPAPGLWGEVYHGIHQRHRAHRAAQHRLVQMLNRFRRAAEALPDALVTLNEHHQVEWLNASATRLLGLRAPQDIGNRIDNLLRHPRFVRSLREEVPSAANVRSPVDGERHLALRLVPFANDRIILVAQDVTERRRIDAIRRDFVASVSHELRTPLTVLKGYLEGMIEERETLPEPWRRPVETMDVHVERMIRLVEDLLLLARVEAVDHRLEKRSVDVARLLGEICEQARAASGAREHQISLDADASIGVRGSDIELRTCFSNLVLNAVQYTHDGGRIDVRWSRDDAGAVFEVRDTGIGIDRAHVPRLTERFYRVDEGRGRSQGGTGLGLAIVKHVLQRHEARLDIESSPGSGSRFRCRFPATRVCDTTVSEEAATDESTI